MMAQRRNVTDREESEQSRPIVEAINRLTLSQYVLMVVLGIHAVILFWNGFR